MNRVGGGKIGTVGKMGSLVFSSVFLKTSLFQTGTNYKEMLNTHYFLFSVKCF